MNQLAIVFILIMAILPKCTQAAEVDYQRVWCNVNNGKMEVSVPGGRIDCLTERYAVEFGFASKWKEDLTQARWYSLKTGKIPAYAIIVGPGDQKYLEYIEDYLNGHDEYVKIIIIPQ